MKQRPIAGMAALLGLCGLLLLSASATWAQRGMGGGGMGGGGMGGGGCCGGSTTVIDPSIGAIFKDPIDLPDLNLDSDPNTVDVSLVAQTAKINVNGVTANLMTYNGLYPGPTIKVKQGNILNIRIQNKLPRTTQVNMLGFVKNITNLHTHGLHVDCTPAAGLPSLEVPIGDYVMYGLKYGESQWHHYDLKSHMPGSLTFYHPHKHGLTAEQFWAGMHGLIVTEDPEPAKSMLGGYETHLMVIKDISLSSGAPAPHSMMNDFMMGKEGNIIMVNGLVNPRLPVKGGQVQRWRILNASNARFYKLKLEGHPLNVIGTDGGLLDKPYVFNDILISPGERLDVLVKAAGTAGNYRLLAMPYARHGMMSSPQITLLTAQVSGSASQDLPAGSINLAARRLDPNSPPMGQPMVPERTLILSMSMGRGYINGMDFDVKPYTIMSTVGTYEIWNIINNSGMDHPFHQHINAAQILSITGGDSNYYNLCTQTPAMKDVVIVPKMGSVRMLVPVMDWGGHAMFHCHILEHEDIGMMGEWHLSKAPMSMP